MVWFNGTQFRATWQELGEDSNEKKDENAVATVTGGKSGSRICDSDENAQCAKRKIFWFKKSPS